MSFSYWIWAIIVTFSDHTDVFSRSKISLFASLKIDFFSKFIFSNKTSRERNNCFTSHLFATITHKVRSIFYYIPIFICHSHTIDIEIIYRNFFVHFKMTGVIFSANSFQSFGVTAIRKASNISILFNEFFIIEFLIVGISHNWSASISKSDNFIVYGFSFVKFPFKKLSRMLSERVRAIKPTIFKIS